MKINKVVIGAFFMLAGMRAHAQLSGFHFQNKISGFKEAGWYSIFLPDTIYSSLNRDLTDIRIYQFSGKDTLESPYILRVLESENIDQALSLPMLNKSTKGGVLYATFQVPANQQVNYLDLVFEEHNFNGFVQIEGSTDQREWFKIDTLKRILSIRRDGLDFTSTDISFPETNYPFLRLAVRADIPLNIITASFKNRVTKTGLYSKADQQYQVSNNLKNRTTTITLSLAKLSLISKVCIGTGHAVDFYRPITIEAVRDSTKSPKGWIYYYETLYTGTITSLNERCFEFPHYLVRSLRISIQNSDNAPIAIKSIDVFGPLVQLVARLTQGENHIYYGNPDIGAPSYDIVHFSEKIPDTPPALTLGKQVNLLHPPEKRAPLFESKNWLWVAMAVVILVLGYFTLSMMKKK